MLHRLALFLVTLVLHASRFLSALSGFNLGHGLLHFAFLCCFLLCQAAPFFKLELAGTRIHFLLFLNLAHALFLYSSLFRVLKLSVVAIGAVIFNTLNNHVSIN